MTMLPVISSNAASFKLVAASMTASVWGNLVVRSCQPFGTLKRSFGSGPGVWVRRRRKSSHELRGRGVSAVRSSLTSGSRQQVVATGMGKPTPVLLVDVMGTLIRDPFYEEIPAYFGMTMKELLAEKHPNAWIEFETGQLNEEELIKKFFADGRDFNIQGLKECMKEGYTYLEGVEELLQRLMCAGYVMHAFSNYPCWYTMIEDKLELSKYMPWTFISCHMGLRKPDAKMYLKAAEQLKLDPSHCIFIDDKRKNVEAAVAVGMKGIVFQDAKQLEEELVALGCCL